MIEESVLECYLAALLAGDKKRSRTVIEQTLQRGTPANAVYMHVIWPIMVEIERLLRADCISPVQEHLATRINRTIVNQLENKLPRRPEKHQKIVICCAENEMHELGAQMMADLFESDGWEVRFLGGGLVNDDMLAYVNKYGPDMLLIYGTEPKQVPTLRKLIDTIRYVNAWPKMRIMVSGGLFNRTEGLWQEIGADLFAATAVQALQEAATDKVNQPEDRQINRRKTRKKANKTVHMQQRDSGCVN